MRVLVLGGTGAMGIFLVKLLEEAGTKTVVTSRGFKSSNGNVKFVEGNAHDLQFIEDLLQEKWDAIVDFMVYTTPSFKERVNSLLKGTSQYIFMSSARVFNNMENPITEKSPRLLETSDDDFFLLTDEYSLTKAKQEDILRNSGRKNWTIIRPYITYSYNRLQLGVLEKEEWLYRALKGRTIVFSKDLSSKLTTLTHGLDVSRGIFTVLGNNKALGEDYNVTINKSNTWENILELYLDVLNRHLGYKPKVLFQEFDDFLKLKDNKYQVIYDRVFNRTFDNSKIVELFKTDKFISLEQGIEECVGRFLKHPNFGAINWKSEALKDKFTNEYTPLNEIKGLKQKVRYFVFRYII